MGFRFRLDTVLRHRRRVVEERSRELATAENRFKARQDSFREMEKKVDRAVVVSEAEEGSPLHLGDLMAKRIWLEHLGSRRDRALRLLEEARVTRDKSRENLEEAWRQNEVLERLRTRKEAEHRKRAERIETQIMDEVASVRHSSGRPAIPAGTPAVLSRRTRDRHSGGP